MADQQPPVTFVDNPLAPDFFAGGPAGYFNFGNTIMITLETPHVNHETTPGPVNRVVVGRLIMPAAGAYTLAAGLFAFLKEQGFNFDGGKQSN